MPFEMALNFHLVVTESEAPSVMSQSYLHDIAWGDACRGALLSRGRQDGTGTGLLRKQYREKLWRALGEVGWH